MPNLAMRFWFSQLVKTPSRQPFTQTKIAEEPYSAMSLTSRSLPLSPACFAHYWVCLCSSVYIVTRTADLCCYTRMESRTLCRWSTVIQFVFRKSYTPAWIWIQFKISFGIQRMFSALQVVSWRLPSAYERPSEIFGDLNPNWVSPFAICVLFMGVVGVVRGYSESFGGLRRFLSRSGFYL